MPLVEREELAAWLRLTLTPGIGNESARRLLAAFGLPDAVFRQSLLALQQVVSPAQASSLRVEPQDLPPLLERSWNWLQEAGPGPVRRRIVVLGDADYPASLLDIDDPPLMLYLLGSGTLADPAPRIAIVGSRNPTPQGETNARQFARALRQGGLVVVSGLALGIDTAAHEGALEALEPESRALVTLAVVGTGLDRVYPRANLALAHRIAQNGLLVSEYPLGTPPLAANFPKRNRLIAGLAAGTLVVEAALQSGSLITARLSAEQGKEVFAIPGSIHAPQARGCHALIKQGAKLVESAQDVLEELKLATDADEPDRAEVHANDRQRRAAPSPPPPHQALLQALGHDPAGLDALQARCGLDTASLQAALMTLELDGQIARLPGGLFQRLGGT